MDVPPRPLLVTDDPVLLDDLLRLATAASTKVTVARTIDQALRSWSHAPLVVVGADLRPVLGTADPPPHPRLVVVTRAANGSRPLPAEEWTRANRAEGERVEGEWAGGNPTGGELVERGPTGADRTGGEPTGGERLLLLPGDESELAGLLAGAVAPRRAPAPTVSVMGGRGGAGASLVAIALALAGARAGRDTVLLDADPLGCGPDVYLGCDLTASDGPGPRTGWDDLLRRHGRVHWRDLRGGLPGTSGVSVLTWTRDTGSTREAPLPVSAARAVLASARHGTDLVVADLPRSFDPATTVFLNHSDLVFVVVPADVPSVVAATRVIPRLREESPSVRAVVRGARGELSADVVAHTLHLPLGADLPPEQGLARLLAAGQVPARHRRSPLARFADSVVADLTAPEPVR